MNASSPILSLLLTLTACAQDPPAKPDVRGKPQAPESAAPATAPDLHTPFGKILKATVADGLVDYGRIRAQHRPALKDYLDTLAATDVTELGRRERFAFYVNLYNATMIEAVLDHTAKDSEWTPQSNEFAVFKEKRVRLKTGTITLDHLENKILRPEFEDPRVHVALVCGARSCPPLLPRAYRARDLDRVLAANMKRFLHDASRNRIDEASETVHLSKIFEWFEQDFGGEAGVRELLRREFGQKVAGYEIRYLDYSWARNERVSPDTEGGR